MKKTTITMLCLAACFAAADTKITWLADVTADRAETVTGVQSNQIRDAAAHIVRADNPHGVTAAQIGALTAEQDLAALAADRFVPIDAGKNVISTDAGSGSIVTYSALIGDRAGNSITGANVIAIGRDAARKAILATGEEEADVIAIGENAAEEAGQLYAVSNAIAIGDSAFKGASGVKAIAIGDDAGFAADMQRGIAVGYGAGYGATLVNSTVIGTDAGRQSTLTNSVAIGPGAGVNATGAGMLFIDSSGTSVADHPEYAMIYGSDVNLTLGKGGDFWPYSTNVLRGNWLFNNNRILTNETDLAALRMYHYGSPDIVESPAEWFVFDGAGKITGFYWEAGRTNVVIPWAIGGVPVTVIGWNAFESSGIVSLIAPQTVTSIEVYAFDGCHSLASISLPQVQTVGGYAFYSCDSLASVPLPQAQTVGNNAFGYCSSLASLYFDNDAPTIGDEIFSDILPNQVTIYVTNPQATGWGATLAGMPVVRLPLSADAITLNGDTITEWPVGGGETSIIAPLYDSGTNVTVTSTQSVYSVAVTGAGPVGIDWSGLSLDGTGRAEVTLRLNVTEWGGTNVTFSPSLTFDRTPEILVTGVWEFAASTVDGATTRVRQTWPECCGWQDVGNLASGSYVQWAAATNASAECNLVPGFGGVIYKFRARGTTAVPVYASYFYDYFSAKALLRENVLLNNGGTWYLAFCPSPKATPGDSNYPSSRFYIDKYGEGQAATTIFTVFWRPANVNERAAYDEGWRP